MIPGPSDSQGVLESARKGVIVDTNLLVVYMVGLFDRKLVPAFSRTKGYSSEDFDVLARLMAQCRAVFVTPQVLAELSNLTPDSTDPRLVGYFETIIQVLWKTREEYVPKEQMLGSDLLPRIGFTDLSILQAAKKHGLLVLTDDLKAAKCLRDAGVDVLNMDAVRGGIWLRNKGEN